MNLYETIIARTPIEKGWSGDKKYRVTTTDGGVYLLRISPMEKLERRRQEFIRMTKAAELGIPMAKPAQFGVTDEGVCTMEAFIEGADAEEYIPTLSRDRQYAYGLDAGRILAKLHTLPAPAGIPDWEIRFNAKIDRKLAAYEACPLKYEKDGPILAYISENRHLLADRPQCFQHGDYHVGNMLVDASGVLRIIDFDRNDCGDPWEEFNRIVWCAQAAPAFAKGMVDGYFEGNVPRSFWQLLALYICSNTLSSLPWAIPFGEGEIQIMRRQAGEILEWYEDLKTVVPGWYREFEDFCFTFDK